MNLSSIQQKLISILQSEFPLTRRPYNDMGLMLGISEEQIISHIKQLKEDGIIRQIGPVFTPGSLGYKTTLAAMSVFEKQMEETTRIIQNHPGISHGYERNHDFNLWFTLASPSTSNLEADLSVLMENLGNPPFFSLPSTRLFKLRAYFALPENEPTETNKGHNTVVKAKQDGLSSMDRIIINELQQDLPIIPHPFTLMSELLGMDEDDFLANCQSLKSRGIMRRFSAAINHHKAGFTANAMTCWISPAEKIETAGKYLASLRQVSHCYERKTNPLWHHNLFAMIHSHTKKECQDIAEKASAEIGLTECIMLFSTKELKKKRIKYLV